MSCGPKVPQVTLAQRAIVVADLKEMARRPQHFERAWVEMAQDRDNIGENKRRPMPSSGTQQAIVIVI